MSHRTSSGERRWRITYKTEGGPRRADKVITVQGRSLRLARLALPNLRHDGFVCKEMSCCEPERLDIVIENTPRLNWDGVYQDCRPVEAEVQWTGTASGPLYAIDEWKRDTNLNSRRIIKVEELP